MSVVYPIKFKPYFGIKEVPGANAKAACNLRQGSATFENPEWFASFKLHLVQLQLCRINLIVNDFFKHFKAIFFASSAQNVRLKRVTIIT